MDALGALVYASGELGAGSPSLSHAISQLCLAIDSDADPRLRPTQREIAKGAAVGAAASATPARGSQQQPRRSGSVGRSRASRDYSALTTGAGVGSQSRKPDAESLLLALSQAHVRQHRPFEVGGSVGGGGGGSGGGPVGATPGIQRYLTATQSTARKRVGAVGGDWGGGAEAAAPPPHPVRVGPSSGSHVLANTRLWVQQYRDTPKWYPGRAADEEEQVRAARARTHSHSCQRSNAPHAIAALQCIRTPPLPFS